MRVRASEHPKYVQPSILRTSYVLLIYPKRNTSSTPCNNTAGTLPGNQTGCTEDGRHDRESNQAQSRCHIAPAGSQEHKPWDTFCVLVRERNYTHFGSTGT